MFKFINVKQVFDKHGPEIALGIGIAGSCTAIIMAIKETPRAEKLLAEAKQTTDDKNSYRKKVLKTVLPCYIPAIATEMLSITMMVFGNRLSAKKNAALAAAYTISETAFKEYRSKVIEKIGDKKERSIRDDICKSEIEKNPVSKNEVIIASSGNTLFYDSFSGRYFQSDIETVKQIENRINKRLLTEMEISLNELYYELGLRCTEQGNQFGFHVDDGLIDFTFSSQITDDGRPCIVLRYTVSLRVR